MSTIEIHEFSTGIEVKGTQSAWESGGFTGEYMNRTLEKIPQAVLDSIANREFALAEGVVRAEPAIVGRVVRGYGESWSVVAVVTRGRDDRGRGVSLYRYFLCKDDGHIETILRWMDKPLLWVFNPFDYREVGQTHQANLNSKEVPLNKFQEMLDQSPPIVFPATENCVPLILNEITRQLRIPNSDRSWAYKVAMLERPEYFQVIYPVDPEAEKVIRETLDRRQSSSALISGESGIKTAIKAVMSGRVKQENIQTLENALVNPQLNEKYWKSLLDKEGASQAFKDNFYGDRYVRLLTLQAMLVPKFLPNFLAWLANSKESETHYNTSLKLQEWISRETQKFTEDFPELSKHLKNGICRVIDRLVDEPQKSKISKESELLLTSESGLWRQVYPSLSEELEEVIRLMGDYIKQRQNWHSLKSKHPQWSSLLDKINKFWYPPEQKDPKYRSLGELFEKVGTKKLAAIFYQIGEGSVPKSVFLEVSGNQLPKKNTVPVLGMEINQRKEIGDYVEDVYFFFFETVNIGEVSMPRFIALIILLVVFTGGFTLGRFSVQLDPVIGRLVQFVTGKAQNNDKKNGNNQQSTFVQNNDNGKTEDVQEETQENRLSIENRDRYQQTDKAIEKIENQLTSEIERQAQYNYNVPQDNYNVLAKAGIPNYFYMDPNNIKTKDIIIYCIKETIGLQPNFQYSKIQEDDAKWEKFSNAIKKYQEDRGARGRNADGVISPNGQTQKWLEQDIRNKCLKPPTVKNPQPNPPNPAQTRGIQ